MKENMSFDDLNLISPIKKAISKQGYKNPTPIQAKSIPGLLQGKDLIGIAQTGTGKTAAFSIPILQRMTDNYKPGIKTLILAPTRELAAQIGESIAKYGKYLNFSHTVIFGGVKQARQVKAIARGVDILVATPGRLLDLMNQRLLTIENVSFFVLDEADRMLDMGFINDIKKIIKRLPKKRQSLFFSATMSPDVNKLAKSLLTNPIHVEVTAQATTVDKIKQHIFFVDKGNKDKLLLELLGKRDFTSVLIFTRTKHKANKLSVLLRRNNISADAIHGNKSQAARTKAIREFKAKRTKVLVATDIAARGIDIDNISHVINYELPNEPESYVHRIGRTARAGTEGIAYSFCAADERNFLRDIEKLTRQKINVVEHEFHSEAAQNAVGAAAKPAPRQRVNPRQKRTSRGKNFGKTQSNSRGKSKSNLNNGSKVKSNKNYTKNAPKGKLRRNFRK